MAVGVVNTYCESNTVLSTSLHHHEGLIITILHIGKLRKRAVKHLVQGYVTKNWSSSSSGLELRHLAPEAVLSVEMRH